MKYTEFLVLSKFIALRNCGIVLLVVKHTTNSIKKYYRRPYYQLLKLYSFLIFFKIYKFRDFKNFSNFWKYIKFNTCSKLLYFLKIYRNYTIFFFSHRVRNLFCIVWQGSNIETFFSSYLCANRNARSNFLPQLKIIRYLVYLYYQDMASNFKLSFSQFSVKIKYIIKIFFY